MIDHQPTSIEDGTGQGTRPRASGPYSRFGVHAAWANRLRGNFHLAIVVLFGAITVLGITPFAIYRFVNGQPLIAAIDLMIVACISAGSIYAWRTGRSIRWDGAKEQIIGGGEASKLLSRAYRDPWVYPKSG